MINKFTMSLVWHNCATCPPTELYNYHLYTTDGQRVFKAQYHEKYGWYNLDEGAYLSLYLLDNYWWADIEQTARGTLEFESKAKVLDGKGYAHQLRQELKNTIESNRLSPTLYIVSIGDDAASQVYVRNKEKACNEVGITCAIQHFNADVSEHEVLAYINEANNDPSIDAVMVQLPIPRHLNTDKIINSIAPEKDVDGLTYVNAGKLQHKSEDALVPCTPLGIIKLLKHYNIDLCGKHCVVVGRSNIVGKPMAELLTNEDATVTICHSKTKDLKTITKTADIVIAALGKPKFITSDYIKDGAIVVDVGINRVNGKLCGDVDFEDVKSKCSFITPVPGGVGPMTVATLLHNVVVAAQNRKDCK